jgi:hypothetical protein
MSRTEKSAAPDPEVGEGLQAGAGSSGGTTFDSLLAEAIATEPDAPAEEDALPAETAPAANATEPATSEAPAPAAASPAEPAATEARADQTKSATPATPPAEPSAKTDEKSVTTTPKIDGPTPEPVAFTFKVDGREVKLSGAREDGDNIVVPKQVWHSEMKNFLADRAAISRREQQFKATVQKLQDDRGAAETVAETMMQELDRIMGVPEADSFEAWEQFRSTYGSKRAQAEAAYWKQRATGHQEAETRAQEEAEMKEFIPVLQQNVRKFADEALTSVKANLSELSEDEHKALGDRLYDLLIDEADAGRIFYHTGEKIQGTTLPKLNVDFQRIAAVVEREVRLVRNALERQAGMKKSLAEVEAAARANAEAEARRRGIGAPPPVSTLTTTAGPVSEAAARSWDDLLAEATQL